MNIKALLDKFAAITEEQGKELTAAMKGKDIAALETFCQKHGIELAAEEKSALAEFFKTGKMPLADQELENVAGGCGGPLRTNCPKCNSTNVREGFREGANTLTNVAFSLVYSIYPMKSQCCLDCGHYWEP